ncbi:Protein required for ethanol metabolism [Tilletia horrida]|nr:Protein required for ethanol metabolism [Tilletia horrida]
MAAAGAGNSGKSFFMRFVNATQATFPRKCASAAFLFASGDVIAQQVIEKRGTKHDVWRTSRLAIYGGVLFAPIIIQWFKVLERIQFQSRAATIGAKVAADQLIAAPNIVVLFFGTTTLMAGGSIEDVKQKLRESWWPTVKANWAVWGPVQTVNMGFIPVDQRLLFVNVIALFWNTYLAGLAAGKQPAQSEIKHEVSDELRRLEKEGKRELVALRKESEQDWDKLKGKVGNAVKA